MQIYFKVFHFIHCGFTFNNIFIKFFCFQNYHKIKKETDSKNNWLRNEISKALNLKWKIQQNVHVRPSDLPLKQLLIRNCDFTFTVFFYFYMYKILFRKNMIEKRKWNICRKIINNNVQNSLFWGVIKQKANHSELKPVWLLKWTCSIRSGCIK